MARDNAGNQDGTVAYTQKYDPDNCIYTAEVVPYTDMHLPFIFRQQKSQIEQFLAFAPPNEKVIFATAFIPVYF